MLYRHARLLDGWWAIRMWRNPMVVSTIEVMTVDEVLQARHDDGLLRTVLFHDVMKGMVENQWLKTESTIR
jgi:hypothetical protein